MKLKLLLLCLGIPSFSQKTKIDLILSSSNMGLGWSQDNFKALR